MLISGFFSPELENLDINVSELEDGRKVDVLDCNGELIDTTTVYDNGLVVYTDSEGTVTESNVSDYAAVVDDETIEQDSLV